MAWEEADPLTNTQNTGRQAGRRGALSEAHKGEKGVIV